MLCAIAIFTATSYVSSTSAYASVEDGARNCASGQKTLNTQKIDLKVMTHDIKGTLELIGQASGIPIVISRKLIVRALDR